MQEDGRTSLHLAVLRNERIMVDNLMKDGANPNLLDNYQNSPLALAIQDNRTVVAQILL